MKKQKILITGAAGFIGYSLCKKLLNNKNYFIKDELTYLDFLAAANFSVIDYLGLLDLKSHENIREWYFKLKSRPSFRTLLKDQIVGLNPHENYKNMDI